MTRSPMMRLTALAVAVSATMAAPTASLAHGYAHSEVAEHAQHHGPDAAHETDHPAIGADDHDEAHGHPRLDPSVFTRVVKDLPAIHSEVVTVASADVVCRETTDAPRPTESPPDRPGVAPPQSRAPPAL